MKNVGSDNIQAFQITVLYWIQTVILKNFSYKKLVNKISYFVKFKL